MAYRFEPDTSYSGTVPSRSGLGVHHTANPDAPYVTLDGASGVIARNAKRLQELRARVEHQGHILPLSMIQQEIKSVLSDSESSDSGPPPPDDDETSSPVSAQRSLVGYMESASRRGLRAAVSPSRQQRDHQPQHLVHKTTFAEIPVGGDVLSHERWYPPPPPPSGVGGVTRATADVVNYTQLSRPQSIGRLARVYEENAPGSPDAASRGFFKTPSVLQPGRNRRQQANQPNIKDTLLAKAPWRSEQPSVIERHASVSPVEGGTPAGQGVLRAPPPVGGGVQLSGGPRVNVAGYPPAVNTETHISYADADLQCNERTLAMLLQRIGSATMLTHLDLSFNPALGDQGFAALAETILGHPNLQYLNLSGCCVGDLTALYISDRMAHTYIQKFDLMWNGITETGAWIMKKRIVPGVAVEEINLLPPLDARQKIKFNVTRPIDALGQVWHDGKLGLGINQSAMIVHVLAGEGECPAAQATLKTGYHPMHAVDPGRLRPGMVISKINGRRVTTDADVEDILSELEDTTLELQVRSNRVPGKLARRINAKLQAVGDYDECEEEEEEGGDGDEGDALYSGSAE